MTSLIDKIKDGKFTKKILLFIIIVGIFSRLLTIFLMPDSAHNDSLFHLSFSKDLISVGFLNKVIDGYIPLPLFYILTSSVFVFSGFEFKLPFIKIIPLIVSFLQILFGYLILRKFFNKNKNLILIGLSFLLIHPTLITYTSLSYVGGLSSVIVLLVFYLLMKFNKEPTKNILILIILSLFSLAVSKLNGTILVPLFVLALAYLMYKKNYSIKTIILSFLILFLLLFVWVNYNVTFTGKVDPYLYEEVNKIFNINFFSLDFVFQTLSFYFTFWELDSLKLFLQKLFSFDTFFNLTFNLISFIIFLILLPLNFSLLFGFLQQIKLFLKKFNIFHLLVFFFSFFLAMALPIRGFDVRALIVILPLMSVTLGVAFSKLNAKHKTIFLISLFLISLMSLSYSIGSIVYFNNKHSKINGMLEFAKTLPDNSYIYSFKFNRSFKFFSNKKSYFKIETPNNFNNYVQLSQDLIKGGYTHIAFSCLEDNWSPEIFKISELNNVKKVYQDDCSIIYEIRQK